MTYTGFGCQNFPLWSNFEASQLDQMEKQRLLGKVIYFLLVYYIKDDFEF